MEINLIDYLNDFKNKMIGYCAIISQNESIIPETLENFLDQFETKSILDKHVLAIRKMPTPVEDDTDMDCLLNISFKEALYHGKDKYPLNSNSPEDIQNCFPKTAAAIDFSKKDSTYKFYIIYYFANLPFNVVLSNISKNLIEFVEVKDYS